MADRFKRVKEATYLSTEKSDKYRAILRYFYIQHERLREFLFPEEILHHVRTVFSYDDYEIDELQNDLQSLVTWGNLSAQQESGKVRTIEEFKKKRFRYQITPYTVEFERMLIQFEQQSEQFGGSLEKSQFERLYQILQQVGQAKEAAPDVCAQIWDDLLTYFKKITQNTSDYFAYLRNEETTEQMKSDVFFLYKDQFTRYLREFIIHMQRTGAAIQELFIVFSRQDINEFLQKVARHQQQVFRFEQATSAEEQMVELTSTWLNIKAWFLGDNNGESQYENVLEQTNEAIRRMTRIIQRLGERNRAYRSRKEDYLHLATWFLHLPTMVEAHKLSAVVFGVEHTKHLYSDHIATEDIYIDVWDETAMAHERMPRIRAYRAKTKASAMSDFTAEKQQLKRIYMEERAAELEIIKQYIVQNRIELDRIENVEPFARKLFLSWIGKAMARVDRIIKTEYGDEVYVEMDHQKMIVLQAQDGRMRMPAVIFHFRNRVGDGQDG